MSGGKDSDCVAALCADRQQRTGRPARFLMADTGHEHEWTYEHVHRLEASLGISVEWVKRDFTEDLARRRARLPRQWREAGVSENLIDDALELLHPTGIPYLDMVMAKGMFAAGASRKFCTEYLKVMPSDDQVVNPLLASGVSVTQWLGIRADESKKRADTEKHPRFGRSGNHNLPARLLLYRPILDWTVTDVIAYHKRRGIPINPLYAFGFNRVGCFPCINERKGAIAIIATRFPAAIDKLREWESLCARVAVARGTQPDKFDGTATFFPAGTVPRVIGNAPIDAVADWAMTSRGGLQVNIFAGAPDGNDALTSAAAEDFERAQDEGHYACTGGMGWCEA